MTVGELKKVIEDVPDDVELTILLPDFVHPQCPFDYMRHVKTAKDCPPSGISGRELEIVAGDYFAY